MRQQMQNENTCDMFTFNSQNEKTKRVKKKEMSKGKRPENQSSHRKQCSSLEAKGKKDGPC